MPSRYGYRKSYRYRTNPLRYGRKARSTQRSLGAMILRRKGVPKTIRSLVMSYLTKNTWRKKYRPSTRYGYRPRNTLRR